MTMPMFNADASLYRAQNHYRSTAAANHPGDEGLTVIPQSCGWFKGAFCGTVIGLGAVACTALCYYGPGPCLACWTAELGGVYQTCHDCIPAWMRALVDAASGDGGGGGVGGGGGSDGRVCCEMDESGRCRIWRPPGGACP